MRNVNRETFIDTLSWYKILPLSKFCVVRVKRNLQKRLKRIWKSYSSNHRSQKLFIQTSNSFEFVKSCEELLWNHRTSTSQRSETDGIAERAARRVKEGTSAVLLQSGSDEKWWAVSMECYGYLRNVQDLLADGKTPYERRFRVPCKGPIIPFGAMVGVASDLNKRSIQTAPSREERFT